MSISLALLCPARTEWPSGYRAVQQLHYEHHWENSFQAALADVELLVGRTDEDFGFAGQAWDVRRII